MRAIIDSRSARGQRRQRGPRAIGAGNHDSCRSAWNLRTLMPRAAALSSSLSSMGAILGDTLADWVTLGSDCSAPPWLWRMVRPLMLALRRQDLRATAELQLRPIARTSARGGGA